jgi:leucyl/phenylalanyl-tRNA--protein transferase
MATHDPFAIQLTPELLLDAYAHGIFPMAESADAADLFWVDPDDRGILPLENFHISKRQRNKLKRNLFEIRIDSDFISVIENCAAARRDSDDTWINAEIIALYHTLFKRGFCHTVEVWHRDEMVGGLYGIALGGAFFGESMFHKVTDASKIALAHLVHRLRVGGYTLLDTQFVTDHLRSLGAVEIPRAHYHQKLRHALRIDGDFYRLAGGGTSEDCLQSTSQIS